MKTELAWAAGFIDGEGSIHIRKDNGYKNPKYSLILTVTNTNQESIEKIKSLFDEYGTTPEIKMRDGNTKPVYRFMSSGNKALHILKQIQPYVIVKREQVKLGIDFQSQETKNMGSKGQPKEYHDLQSNFYEIMKLLNKTSGEIL